MSQPVISLRSFAEFDSLKYIALTSLLVVVNGGKYIECGLSARQPEDLALSQGFFLLSSSTSIRAQLPHVSQVGVRLKLKNRWLLCHGTSSESVSVPYYRYFKAILARPSKGFRKSLRVLVVISIRLVVCQVWIIIVLGSGYTLIPFFIEPSLILFFLYPFQVGAAENMQKVPYKWSLIFLAIP
jgi:hypothetical protein